MPKEKIPSDILTLASIEDAGGFIRPSQKRGRPFLSFGAFSNSPQFRIAMQVATLAEETGNISEAQRQVSARESIPFETVKTYCKRYLKDAKTNLELEKTVIGQILRIRQRLSGCPDDVMARISQFTPAAIENLLDRHAIDYGPPAWFIHCVRSNQHLGDRDLFGILASHQA